MFKGKKYVDSAKLIDRSMQYEVADAMDLVVKTATAKFDETIEVHVKLGVDSRHADQQVRGAVVLPNGTGKNVRVCVFCKEDKMEAAKAAGAEFVGAQDLVDKILKENWMDFDVAIATPDMMGQVGRIGRVLGPRGLMPNPKAGTVTMDVAQAVKDVKAGKVEYRTDKQNIVHVLIGKASFDAQQISENLKAVMAAIVKAKPASAKGKYLKSVTVANTMGPGIALETTSLMELGK